MLDFYSAILQSISYLIFNIFIFIVILIIIKNKNSCCFVVVKTVLLLYSLVNIYNHSFGHILQP